MVSKLQIAACVFSFASQRTANTRMLDATESTIVEWLWTNVGSVVEMARCAQMSVACLTAMLALARTVRVFQTVCHTWMCVATATTILQTTVTNVSVVMVLLIPGASKTSAASV